MGFGKKGLGQQPGKRHLGRLRVRLPAKLVTLSRTYPVILLDISGGGAKLEIEGECPRGEVMLRWNGFEAHGAVCWQKGGRFGLAFDHKVQQGALEETARVNETGALPDGGTLIAHAAQAWADGTGKFGFD